jgi:hypothetical protein
MMASITPVTYYNGIAWHAAALSNGPGRRSRSAGMAAAPWWPVR